MAYECLIEEDRLSFGIKIWLRYQTHNGKYYYTKLEENNLFKDVEVQEGMTIEPSLVLRKDMLEAILKEAEGYLPATDATTKHLDDAVMVRDRLLTMVERASVPPRILTPGEVNGE